MMDSRVHPTQVVGQAIAAAARPPRVWLQMSTATIYAHRLDAAHGAFAIRTDTELLLKSRRVIPGRLLDAGFRFDHPQWREAAADLVRRRWRDAAD
jgi:NAD dependent epimerase/dehydratase family enzyme